MDYIIRPKYLKKINQFVDKPVVKILTGMRRVGKSTFDTDRFCSTRMVWRSEGKENFRLGFRWRTTNANFQCSGSRMYST